MLSHFPYWLLSNCIKKMYKAEALGGVCVLECVHAGEELQSGMERKVGSVDFALTEGCWQVKFRRTLSCRGNMDGNTPELWGTN